MTALAWLIPAAMFLGLLGLGAFLWALNSGQFDDLEGAAWRALDDTESPGSETAKPKKPDTQMPEVPEVNAQEMQAPKVQASKIGTPQDAERKSDHSTKR